MSSLAALGAKPPHVTADEHFGPWLAELVGKLLNNVDFVVGGKAGRFFEGLAAAGKAAVEEAKKKQAAAQEAPAPEKQVEETKPPQ